MFTCVLCSSAFENSISEQRRKCYIVTVLTKIYNKPVPDCSCLLQLVCSQCHLVFRKLLVDRKSSRLPWTTLRVKYNLPEICWPSAPIGCTRCNSVATNSAVTESEKPEGQEAPVTSSSHEDKLNVLRHLRQNLFKVQELCGLVRDRELVKLEYVTTTVDIKSFELNHCLQNVDTGTSSGEGDHCSSTSFSTGKHDSSAGPQQPHNQLPQQPPISPPNNDTGTSSAQLKRQLKAAANTVHTCKLCDRQYLYLKSLSRHEYLAHRLWTTDIVSNTYEVQIPAPCTVYKEGL